MTAMARKFDPAVINVENFAASNPAEYKWMIESAPKFEFAQSMIIAVSKWGSLTERQMAAVKNCMEKSAQRAAAKANPAPAPSVNTDALNAAFDKALSNGLKRPKMRFEGFSVSLAPSSGKNPGALYVKSGDTYLGKVVAGQFFSSYDCDTATKARVIEIMQDPTSAAIAYARRTGNCSICGAELTNEESIKRGIGPICAGKFGL